MTWEQILEEFKKHAVRVLDEGYGDWTGLYWDGILVHEDHTLDFNQVFDVPCIEVDMEKNEEEFGGTLFETLEETKKYKL